MEKQISDKEILIQVLENFNMNPNAFSKLIGVEKNTIYKVISGERDRLTKNTIAKILAVFPNINPEFLSSGTLPIVKEEIEEDDFEGLKDGINDSASVKRQLFEIYETNRRIELRQARIEKKLDELIAKLSFIK